MTGTSNQSAVETSGPATASAMIAARFVAARLSRQALPAYPGEAPLDLATAYAIQDAAIDLFHDTVVGWKVGMVPAALQPSLGARRLAGPIFRQNLWTASAVSTPLPAIVGGFAAVEAEFVARIGPTDPAKLDWSLEEAVDRIEGLHIGVELAGSPLSTINALGSAVVASDFGNNGGLLLGPEIEDWRARLDGIEVETVIDGGVVGAGTAASIPAGILESVRFLLEHCARRGRPVGAGTLISTGAVTGVHQVAIGARSTCVFSGVGALHCTVVAATA